MAILGDTKAISLTLLDGVIGNLNPKTTDIYTLGTSSLKWNNIYSTTFTGALSGNASTATKLAASKTINGTAFDGSGNITTANWGTARNISISDSDGTNTGSAVSVNGSAAVTLKLPSTIKATLSGNASTATKLAASKTIQTNLASTSSASFDGSANITPGVTGTLGTGNGGTGNTSFTANRIVYSETATKLSTSGHYASSTKIAVNSTSEPSYNLYVGGNAYIQTGSSNSTNVGATINNGLFAITNYSNTMTIGSRNASYGHFQNSADIPFYFNKSIWVDGSLWPYGDSNTKSLGTSTKRWKELFVGTADSYGSGTQPVYWNNGVPKATTYSLAKSVPSDAVFTDTDTKVTSVDNHYSPSANSDSALSASATGASAAWSIDVVKGVTISRDAKGHVTGVSVTSGKIPANPNTDTKQRTYRSSTNVELPIAGINTGNATAAYSAISSGSYKDVYAAIPENTDNVATINPSTGTITAKVLSATNIYSSAIIEIDDWIIDANEGIGNYDWGEWFIWMDSGALKAYFDVIGTANIGTSSPTSSTPKAGVGSLYFQYATTVSDNPLGAVDWVVEQGIASDIWIYRKWNSGYIEAWRNGPLSYGSLATSSQWQYGYYYSSVITMGMPKINDVALFTSVKYGQCSTVSGTGLLYCAIKTLANDKIEFYLANSKSETVTVSVTAYVFGTWK